MLIRFGSDADPTCMQMDEVCRRRMLLRYSCSKCLPVRHVGLRQRLLLRFIVSLRPHANLRPIPV